MSSKHFPICSDFRDSIGLLIKMKFDFKIENCNDNGNLKELFIIMYFKFKFMFWTCALLVFVCFNILTRKLYALN